MRDAAREPDSQTRAPAVSRGRSPTSLHSIRTWAAVTGLCVIVAAGLVAVLATRSAISVSRVFVAAVGVSVLACGSISAIAVGRSVRQIQRAPLTLATVVTSVRGGLVATLGGFLVVPPVASGTAWLPGAVYGVAVLLDAVDGVVARATDAVTDVGDRLDAGFDAFGILLGTMLAVTIGAAPLVFVLVGLARYAFVVGCWRRRRLGLSVRELPPSRLRRPLAALAMVVTVLALLPVPGPGASRVLAYALTVPFLASFVRDWLAVSGRHPRRR